jgi:phosphoglycolate phosphatase-like HAD superfamily hydrolase
MPNLSQRPKVDRRTILLGATTAVAAATLSRAARAQADPLSSWNDGPAKQAILDFVRAIGQVPPEDRIATFDQDGTLWVEHPVYTQAMFALERVHILAAQHPEWKDQEPFKSVLAGDETAIAKFSERDWAEIVFATHAGMSQAEFQDIVRKWLATAKHPRFKRPYTDLVYQPMREVMDYLRANGFKTYIVTGGGQDFVRNYAERIYGLPPEQVIGSSIATKYEIKDGEPQLTRLPKLFFDDDHAGKAM